MTLTQKLRLRVVAIVCSLLFMATPALAATGECSTVLVTDALDLYVPVGRDAPVSISFEPDATGTETIARLSLQMCTRQTSASCVDYDFDTDADGLGDTNILTGATIELSGLKDIRGFNYLRIQSSTNPSGTDVPEFSICRGK